LKTIAIIPAREGSKRIPRKNIQPFLGKPILAYAIQVAIETQLFDRIVVSTDSEEIAEVACRFGAEVPFMRPPRLAGDYTTVSEVLIHAIQWLRKHGDCDYACCLYATNPLLQPASLRDAFAAMQRQAAKAALSVVKYGTAIERALDINADGRAEMIRPEHAPTRTQDLPEHYYDAGQFIWLEALAFLEKQTVFAMHPLAVVLPEESVQDIDTPDDWRRAEAKFKIRQAGYQSNKGAKFTLPTDAVPLVLGTAQLGFGYGLANRVGKPDARAANTMLCAAWAANVRVFDTAQAYGESESILGDFFAGSHGFADARFITKLHPNVNVSDSAEIRRYIDESLRRLRMGYIWSLLLHSEQHLDIWDGVLGDTLRELKNQGIIRYLGVSVYSEQYARRAISNADLDMVELPGNVFDRRTKRAMVDTLAHDFGKTLLVRSIFLQGLALMAPGEVPNTIPRGAEAVETLTAFCRDHGLMPREFAYDYVRACYPDALTVVGADSVKQVVENCQLTSRKPIDRRLVEAWDTVWPDDVDVLVDPSRWRVPGSRQSKVL
jgi:N-acylneuraminate cytidylyltransferase